MCKIGIPNSIVNIYRNMTTNMRIYFGENDFIEYKSGLPQGSIMSPVLFNLYFNNALKTISPLTDMLLAYADDVALAKENSKSTLEIAAEFSRWKNELNLKVNNRKTKFFIKETNRPSHMKYEVVQSYKYLGVEIFQNKKKLNKSNVIQNIKQNAIKFGFKMICSRNNKVNKLVICWWFLSKMLYHHISDVFLNFINASDFKQILLVEIKKNLGICMSIPQIFVEEFFSLNITKTVKNMINDISIKGKNYGIASKIITENEEIEDEQIGKINWRKALNFINFTINQFYFLFCRNWYKNKAKCICKICNKQISIRHILDFHQEYSKELNQYEKSITEQLAKGKKCSEIFNQYEIDGVISSAILNQTIHKCIQIKENSISNLNRTECAKIQK